MDTFIAVAPDATARAGTPPPGETVAALTYRVISEQPYHWHSSDVIFTVWATRHGIAAQARATAWAEFYSKPRACLRSSDLAKKWGWGIHADRDGRLMVYAVGSVEYEQLAAGTDLVGRPVQVRPAFRSRR